MSITFAELEKIGLTTPSGLPFVDDFAGAGGASQGLREAGLVLVQAANHSAKAIETHSANFPDADHLMTDLLVYNPRKRPRAAVYWASPECTWHSPAGGRKRKRQMLDMFDEYVPDELGERSRLTMMTVLGMAEAKRYPVIFVENVVEVADWEMFEVWLSGFKALGYEHQILSVSAAHVWSEGNRPAPQWRDRVYFVFYLRGINFPDVAPRPWAFCPECAEDVRARQAWKRADRRPIGKYRAQYNYVCPRDNHKLTIVEPYVMPALDALDLSDLGERIGDRKRALAAATVRRIKVGYLMFGGDPEIVAHTGQTWDAAKPGHRAYGDPNGYHRVASIGDPLKARDSTPGDAVVHPYLSTVNHAGEHHGRALDPAEGPLPTRSTKLGEGIVTPFISHHYGHTAGDERRNDSVDTPLGTITAGGAHHELVTPFVAEYYGTGSAKPVDEPLGTVSTREHHGLVTPFVDVARTNNLPRSAVEPIAPLTTGRNHALVTPYVAELWGTSTAHSAEDPLAAVTAGGNHHGLTTPDDRISDLDAPVRPGETDYGPVTEEDKHHGRWFRSEPKPMMPFLSKHHGGLDYGPIGHMNKPISEPMPTMVGKANVSLITPTKRPRVDATPEQLDAIDISDFRFRMLSWREHASAQRFPRDYTFTGNSSENTLMAGNAVASNVAHYLGLLARVALGDLDVELEDAA